MKNAPQPPLPKGMELLAPAGSPRALDAALRFGAQAVYLGGGDLNLRRGTKGFALPALRQAVATAHSQGVRVYYTLNILAQDHQLPAVANRLEELADTGIDALILADPGVIREAARRVPHIPIHVSTQANTSNRWSVHFWRDQGARRVNLARELSAPAIRAICRACPDMELEIFVHGAMCMAISGQCLLSAFLVDRSGNQGACAHPCRYDYRVRGLLLEEFYRQGEILWEAEEEEGFTQIFASHDLCLVPMLPWMARHGIHGCKIEGRMKNIGYVAITTDVYATALRDLKAGRFRPTLYLQELAAVASRPLSTGFFAPQRRILPLPTMPPAPIALQVQAPLAPGRWEVAVLTRLEASQTLEILLPGLRRIHLTDYALENQQGQRCTTVHGGSTAVLCSHHPELAPGALLRPARPQEPLHAHCPYPD
jgi:putative protease